MPMNAVWNYYCEKAAYRSGLDWYGEVKQYEKDVLLKRDQAKGPAGLPEIYGFKKLPARRYRQFQTIKKVADSDLFW